MKLTITILITIMMTLSGCCGSKNTITQQTVAPNNSVDTAMPVKWEGDIKGMNAKMPEIVIYKTDNDYLQNVPVIMDAAHKNIVSYPDPKDVYLNGVLAVPTPLKHGYLLDNRGINENVAFTSYTYEDYSKLAKAPSVDEVKEKIIAYYPIIEMYYCGERNTNDNINKYLDFIDNNFSGCTKAVGITNTNKIQY